MQHPSTRSWLRNWLATRRIELIIIVFGAGLIGLSMLSQSIASTFVEAGEAETGVLEGNVIVKTEESASGGSIVMFGDVPASPTE
jgi:hypothetical protein